MAPYTSRSRQDPRAAASCEDDNGPVRSSASKTERIPVVSEDVLDIHPRKVCYFPVTGKAMVKRLAHAHPEALLAQERKGNAVSVAQSSASGSVDLF